MITKSGSGNFKAAYPRFTVHTKTAIWPSVNGQKRTLSRWRESSSRFWNRIRERHRAPVWLRRSEARRPKRQARMSSGPHIRLFRSMKRSMHSKQPSFDPRELVTDDRYSSQITSQHIGPSDPISSAAYKRVDPRGDLGARLMNQWKVQGPRRNNKSWI